MERTSESSGGVPSHESAVRIEGLEVRYGSVEAVRAASFTASPGEVVALLGANGAGKSSMIACLLGLRVPNAGTVEVTGTAPRRAVHMGRVGAMLQVSALPAGARVSDVVRLLVALHGGRGATIAELLTIAGLSDLARREVTTLSGGQAQRVRFAMAIAGTPSVLFLDEPTTGMDVHSRALFWDGIRRLAGRGVTALVATHNLDEADRFSDRVVMLAHGKVVADGPAADLKARFADGRTIELVADEPSAIVALHLVDDARVSVHGKTVRLRVADTDAVLRRLYTSGLAFTDLTVTGGDLDDAFRSLSHSEEES